MKGDTEDQEKYEMAKKIYAETFAAIAGRVAYSEHVLDCQDMSGLGRDLAFDARRLTEAALDEFFCCGEDYWCSLGGDE